MRTRTFIGLIFLIAALFVASNPALLEPTAQGVERVALRAGVIDEPKQEPGSEVLLDAKQKKSADPVEARLQLNGYVREESGDLRDTTPIGERETNTRRRLESGTYRAQLPGEYAYHSSDSPPIAAEGKLLLDAEGCPVLRPEVDIVKLVGDEKEFARYEAQSAKADDPEVCEARFAESMEAALPAAQRTAGTTTPQEQAAIHRASTIGVMVALTRISMLESMMGADERVAALASLRGDAADTAAEEGEATAGGEARADAG